MFPLCSQGFFFFAGGVLVGFEQGRRHPNVAAFFQHPRHLKFGPIGLPGGRSWPKVFFRSLRHHQAAPWAAVERRQAYFSRVQTKFSQRPDSDSKKPWARENRGALKGDGPGRCERGDRGHDRDRAFREKGPAIYPICRYCGIKTLLTEALGPLLVLAPLAIAPSHPNSGNCRSEARFDTLSQFHGFMRREWCA